VRGERDEPRRMRKATRTTESESIDPIGSGGGSEQGLRERKDEVRARSGLSALLDIVSSNTFSQLGGEAQAKSETVRTRENQRKQETKEQKGIEIWLGWLVPHPANGCLIQDGRKQAHPPKGGPRPS
jgi:hypothetical protein